MRRWWVVRILDWGVVHPSTGEGWRRLRARTQRGGDRLQHAITAAARCTREPAPRLLSTRGFYWPSIRFLCGTHLHTMKAVCAPPFTEDSLSSRHYGMSLSHCSPLPYDLYSHEFKDK